MAALPQQTALQEKKRGTGSKPGESLASALLLHAVLIIGAVIMSFPFLWMILTSFKDFGQAFQVPPTFLPDPWIWSNYPNSWEALPFNKAYFNSFYITTLVV